MTDADIHEVLYSDMMSEDFEKRLNLGDKKIDMATMRIVDSDAAARMVQIGIPFESAQTVYQKLTAMKFGVAFVYKNVGHLFYTGEPRQPEPSTALVAILYGSQMCGAKLAYRALENSSKIQGALDDDLIVEWDSMMESFRDMKLLLFRDYDFTRHPLIEELQDTISTQHTQHTQSKLHSSSTQSPTDKISKMDQGDKLRIHPPLNVPFRSQADHVAVEEPPMVFKSPYDSLSAIVNQSEKAE